MADTPNGETVTPGASQTTVQTTTTSPTPPASQDNGVDPAEVERLRKEAEQAKMRAQQLENEKAERDKRDAEAEQKRLEENNQWKEVAEQEKAKREALEKEREDAVAKVELETAQADILKEFPQTVAEAAQDIDLSLSENTPEALEAFKSKLNKLSEKVGADNRVTGNNSNPNQPSADRQTLIQEHAKRQSITPGDTPEFHQALGGLNWIQQAKATNGDE